MPVVRIGMENNIFCMYEMKFWKNFFMRTYLAGAYTRCVSTKYVASDGSAIIKNTQCVWDDVQVSIIKGQTNAGVCEMKREVSLQIIT
jgi:hypothetical protein